MNDCDIEQCPGGRMVDDDWPFAYGKDHPIWFCGLQYSGFDSLMRPPDTVCPFDKNRSVWLAWP
jgi:hypothetical protein